MSFSGWNENRALLVQGLFLAVVLLAVGLVFGVVLGLSMNSQISPLLFFGIGGFFFGLLAANLPRLWQRQRSTESPLRDGIKENLAKLGRNADFQGQSTPSGAPSDASFGPASGSQSKLAGNASHQKSRPPAAQPKTQESRYSGKTSEYENPEVTEAEWPIRNSLDAEPALAATQEPAARSVSSDRLIEVWRAYWKNGDGHFNTGGLKSEMAQQGLSGKVYSGAEFGAGNSVLGVDLEDSGVFYLLPDFNKPPSAVNDYFEDRTGGALTARIKDIERLARGTLGRSGFELETKGAVR